VLPEDGIWQNARDVWKELPNSKVVPRSTEILQNQALKACEKHVVHLR
jgi:hypothetical protein